MNPETQAARSLLAAGVPDAALDRVLRMVDVDDTDDRKSIDVKVAELKATMPAVFAAQRVPPPAGGRRVSGRDAMRAKWAEQSKGKTMEQVGREAAERMGIPVKPVDVPPCS